MRKPLAPDDPRHGKYTTYKNHGCRCAPCREASSAAMRKFRAQGGRTGIGHKVTNRATVLAARWTRENRKDIWYQCVDQAREECGYFEIPDGRTA